MRTSSALLAMLAVPAAMAGCPRRGGAGTPKASSSSVAVPVIESSTTSIISSATSIVSSATQVVSPATPIGSAISTAVPAPVAGATSDAITGTSTFYGGNLNGGTCSFSTYTLPSGIYGTAFSGSAWHSAQHCGACVEVTANGKSIIAMVSYFQTLTHTSACSFFFVSLAHRVLIVYVVRSWTNAPSASLAT